MQKRLALLLALLLLTGCTAREPESTGRVVQTSIIPTATAAPLPADFSEAIDTKEMDFTFTDRELAGTYEAHKAVEIIGSGASCTINGAGATLDGNTITITNEGAFRLSGTFTDLLLTISAGESDKVQLVLDSAVMTNQSGPCIYVQSADKVFITLPEGSQSSLTDGASYAFTDGDTVVDAAIFSRTDLCINGAGTLTVNGQYKHGVVSKDDLIIAGSTLNVTSASTALDGKDCVMTTGATLTLSAGSNAIRSDNAEDENRGFVYLTDSAITLTAGNDGVQAETVLICRNVTLSATAGGGSGYSLRSADGSWKGLKSGGDMWLGGGSYTISSRDDCIHSNSSIVMEAGTFALSSGDDGVHADTNLTVNGGEIAISKSYEGLEASKLIINGGRHTIVASDDGLNAAGGADGSGMGSRFGRGMFSNGVGEIEINGGYTVVNATGDGVDSNSSIRVTGGVTLVSGPVSSGNAAFDYDGEATVTGGVLIATGASGMAQNFSSAENQGAMLVSFNQRLSSSLALVDESGQVVVSFTPETTYQSAVVTAPAVQEGRTYSIISGGSISGADEHGFAQNASITGGSTVAEVEMTSLLYGSGGFGMWNRPGNFGPGGGGGGGGGGGNRRGW